MGLVTACKKIYLRSTGYSYTHMGRMFLRLFVGLMLAQFGIHQLLSESVAPNDIMYLSYGLPLWLIISVELFCSFCIMIGFLTRILILPPMVLMICAAATMSHLPFDNMELNHVVYLALPFLFMGIYFFLLVVGPGKISIDYFYSLYLINRQKDSEQELSEEDLEEV